MQIIDCIQGTPEWYQVRLGRVTASCFGKAIAGGQGKTSKAYMLQLIAERLTNEQQESYSNAVMQRGSEIESLAREYYELLNDCPVRQVGFIKRGEDVGASPDGLVGNDGELEIKCPNSTTHIETILTNKVPTAHRPQLQGGMWVSEREWVDFVSYDPRVKQRPFFCERVYRDDAYIKELNIKIIMFIQEMKEIISKLTKSPF